MIDRCTRPGSTSFPRYGARGVKVCEEWKDYIVFRDWALATGYRADLTIDRWPNKKGDYEPTNCRWATPLQQNRNRTNNRLLEFDGQTRCLNEWAEITGNTRETIRDRLERGWEVGQALFDPVDARRIRKPHRTDHT
jgi:hypothetical protein